MSVSLPSSFFLSYRIFELVCRAVYACPSACLSSCSIPRRYCVPAAWPVSGCQRGRVAIAEPRRAPPSAPPSRSRPPVRHRLHECRTIARPKVCRVAPFPSGCYCIPPRSVTFLNIQHWPPTVSFPKSGLAIPCSVPFTF